MKTLFVFTLFIGSAFLLEFDHPCRTDVKVKENFLPAAYTGIWYEIQRTDIGDDCLIHHYTRATDNSFNVMRDGRVNGVDYTEDGIAALSFPDETPLLAVFNATLNRRDGSTHVYNYQIVHSDYANYAITWLCEDLPGDRSNEEGVILGRTTVLSEHVNNQINFFLQEININREEFAYVDHSFETCFL